jgi:MFS family permease
MSSSNFQKRNYIAFLIHALFLALTLNFIDVNTVVPNMMGELGANETHLGLLTAIMIGGSSFMQLIFATMIVPLKKKKPALLIGIYLRVISLFILGLFLLSLDNSANWKIWAILALMAIFSFSGAFANISYTDILGRAIDTTKRKDLLMKKQLISGLGVIVSSVLVKIILTRYSYPTNYSHLFVIGSIILLLATIGFWLIKEPIAPVKVKEPLSKRFSQFFVAIKEDPNVRKYLLFINTSGVILSLIPFLILFGRTNFTISGSRIGTYLLIQVGGGLITNILLQLFYKEERYKPLLYLFICIGASTPIVALLLSFSPTAYALTFLFSGSAIELYKIVAPGVLLEISNDENRTIYTGLAGAGSIMNIIYPIVAGLVIGLIGYNGVFILTSVYMLTGFFFARSIVCARFTSESLKR